MANYNVEKLTKLGALKQLAERMKTETASKAEFNELSKKVTSLGTDVDTLEGKVETLEAASGEKNVIVGIKINDESVTVGDDRVAKISVPKDTKDLINGAGFQNASEVEKAVTDGINAWADKATDNGTIDTFKELVEYVADHEDVAAQLVSDIAKNAQDISSNTSNIAELQERASQFETNYVQKDGNKVLSTNDYTAADKAKVDSIDYASEQEVSAMLNEVFTAV